MPWTDSIKQYDYTLAQYFTAMPAWNRGLANGRTHLRTTIYTPGGNQVDDSHGCFDGTYIWALNNPASAQSPVLMKINPQTGSITTKTLTDLTKWAYNIVYVNDIALNYNYLCIFSYSERRVLVLNYADLTKKYLVTLHTVGGSNYGSQMCYANGYLWIPRGNYDGLSCFYVDYVKLGDGSTSYFATSNYQNYQAAYDGSKVYITNLLSNIIMSFTPDITVNPPADLTDHTLDSLTQVTAITAYGNYLYFTASDATKTYACRWNKIDGAGSELIQKEISNTIVPDIKIANNKIYIPHEDATLSLVSILSLDLQHLTTVIFSRTQQGKCISTTSAGPLVYVFFFDDAVSNPVPFTYATISGTITP